MQADSTATAAAPFRITDPLSALVGKVEGWVAAFVLHLPNLLVAVVIVVAAALAARLVRAGVRRGVGRMTAQATHARTVVELLATLSSVAVLATGCFMALGVLQLDGVVTSLLAGAGILGLALGFAFQDIASNFIAGVLMAIRTPFVVGQIIETNGFTGTVAELSLRSTVLTTVDGRRVILPNAKVYGDAIVNHSARRERRVDVVVRVDYGDDLAVAERAALDAVTPLARDNHPVRALFTEFGDPGVVLEVRFWVDFEKQGDLVIAKSEAIKAIRSAFEAAGLTIPLSEA